jgi:NAD(P)-dependent dehydrogenase (short-subunit alcohol dehydrogenase family)
VGRLEGRTALVTGGASGIGRAVCLAFAREGADVAVADRDLPGARAVADQVEALGRRALALHADVTDESQVEQMAREALDGFQHLDVLVANAGITAHEVHLSQLSLVQWRHVVDGCLTGTFLTVRAVLPHMIARGSGRVITTSSQLAHKPVENMSAYCAAKAAVVAMTVAVAHEVARYGIRVNSVAPGPTRTAMALRPELAPLIRERIAQLPIGRQAEPEEIAPAYVFLASDDAEYMIGQTVSPNGGDVSW